MALNLNLSYPLARYYNHFMESIRIYRKKKELQTLGPLEAWAYALLACYDLDGIKGELLAHRSTSGLANLLVLWTWIYQVQYAEIQRDLHTKKKIWLHCTHCKF